MSLFIRAGELNLSVSYIRQLTGYYTRRLEWLSAMSGVLVGALSIDRRRQVNRITAVLELLVALSSQSEYVSLSDPCQ